VYKKPLVRDKIHGNVFFNTTVVLKTTRQSHKKEGRRGHLYVCVCFNITNASHILHKGKKKQRNCWFRNNGCVVKHTHLPTIHAERTKIRRRRAFQTCVCVEGYTTTQGKYPHMRGIGRIRGLHKSACVPKHAYVQNLQASV
jgi:hypothetical protein